MPHGDLLVAALTATEDARGPEALDAFEAIVAREVSAADGRAIAVRRRDLAWYQRHGAAAGPLLRAWSGR